MEQITGKCSSSNNNTLFMNPDWTAFGITRHRKNTTVKKRPDNTLVKQVYNELIEEDYVGVLQTGEDL